VADQLLALRSERWNDIVFLSKSVANVGADSADSFVPPSGIGDIAIMEVQVAVTTAATMVASINDWGLEGFIINAAGDTFVDLIGTGRWAKQGASSACAYLSPDPLVLCRQGEKIYLAIPEIDTNASPTGDIAVYVKAVRVQPAVTPAKPIQLVR